MLHALSHGVSPATLTLCCLSRDTVLGANVLSPNTVNVWRCRDLHVWPTADSSPAQFRLSRRTRVCSSPSGSWLQAVIFLGYCSTRFIIWLSVDSLNAANRLNRSPLRRWPWTRLFDWNKTLAGGLVSSATIQVGSSRISVLWSLVWPKSTQVHSSSSTESGHAPSRLERNFWPGITVVNLTRSIIMSRMVFNCCFCCDLIWISRSLIYVSTTDSLWLSTCEILFSFKK